MSNKRYSEANRAFEAALDAIIASGFSKKVIEEGIEKLVEVGATQAQLDIFEAIEPLTE